MIEIKYPKLIKHKNSRVQVLHVTKQRSQIYLGVSYLRRSSPEDDLWFDAERLIINVRDFPYKNVSAYKLEIRNIKHISKE